MSSSDNIPLTKKQLSKTGVGTAESVIVERANMGYRKPGKTLHHLRSCQSCLNRSLIVATSFITAVSFGLSYGDGGSNHAVYLISGMRIRSPEFLANDWWAAQTSHYHHAFAYLVAGLSGLNILPWAMAVGNILAVLLVLGLLYHLASLIDRNHAPLTWLIVAALFFCISGTRSVATTYLFSPSLQPSTISSVFFFAAMTFYIRGNYPISGLSLGISSLFHTNFLILGLAFFGLGHLMLGKKGLFRRLLGQLALSLVVLAVQMPGIIHTMGLDLPQEVKVQADRILIDIAGPFHYKPITFLIEYTAFFGWCLIAWSMIRGVFDSRDFGNRYKSLFASSLILIIAATLLTTVVFVGLVSRLFVLRLAPFCMLLAYVVVAEGAVRIFTTDAKEKSFPGPWNMAGFLLGFIVILPSMVRQRLIFTASGHLATPSAGMIFLGACLVGLWWSAKFKGAELHFAEKFVDKNRIMLLLSLALAVAVADEFSLRRFNLLYQSDPAEGELYAWAARTDPDSLFIVPPNMISFRLFAKRAVVAENKAVPYRPDETLEWHERLKTICGEEYAGSLQEMEKGYALMDQDRLRRAAAKYGVDYVVVYKEMEIAKDGLEIVFENETFKVLRPPGN